ncbi:MAG: threonine synthase, partial [Patiriisocius sp.]
VDEGIIVGESVDEECTQLAMVQLANLGYVSEPHAAIGYRCLSKALVGDEVGIFLGTAHPAKFRETVENVLGQPIALPEALAKASAKEAYSVDVNNSYEALKAHMFSILK